MTCSTCDLTLSNKTRHSAYAYSYQDYHKFCLPLFMMEDREYELAAAIPSQGRAAAYWYLIRQPVRSLLVRVCSRFKHVVGGHSSRDGEESSESRGDGELRAGSRGAEFRKSLG